MIEFVCDGTITCICPKCVDCYINYQLMAMPNKIRAVLIRNCDDGYTIFINQNMPKEVQVKAVLHELRHIKRGDFNKLISADLVESLSRA